MVMCGKGLKFYFQKIILLSIFFICVFINSARALELPYINKSKIRLSIPCTEAKYGEIIVENSTSETRKINIYLGDWRYLAAADGSKEFPPVNTTPLSGASWISFSPSEITLPPFSKKQVSYAVKVPKDAKEGGRYAALFFESNFGKFESGQKEMGAALGVVIRIATLFYIEVEGTVNRSASIENLTLKEETKPEERTFQLDFKNTGNVDITASGTCHIIDEQGMVYARGKFNDVYSFPGDTAKLTAVALGAVPKGVYDAVFTIDLGKALEEVGLGQGPVVTKEAKVEFAENGRVIRLGELK